jgi:hypothetical protein
MSAIEELELLYRQFLMIPFPPSHDDEEIQDIHDTLIVYDAEVAGLVSRILKGEKVAGKHLREDPKLRRRIEDLIERKREADDLLRLYLEYYGRLAQLISLAKKALSE